MRFVSYLDCLQIRSVCAGHICAGSINPPQVFELNTDDTFENEVLEREVFLNRMKLLDLCCAVKHSALCCKLLYLAHIIADHNWGRHTTHNCFGISRIILSLYERIPEPLARIDGSLLRLGSGMEDFVVLGRRG